MPNKRNVDLRSDTVTLQPQEMKDAMLRARVGDEYYGDDPTVIELQELAARMLGKESALFTASGTMGNLVSILTHARRREMMIMEYDAHSFRCEVGNFVVAGGIVPKLVKGRLGVMEPDDIEAAVPATGWAFSELTMLAVENTHNGAGGTCVSPEYMAGYRKVADKHGLKIHVDGARIFNSAVAQGVDVKELARDADSLTFCLSKGLACPFGAVIVGSKDFTVKARKYQQMVGGGFRQIGYMAAAGIYALNNMVDRLADDHRNAKRLADGLIELGMDVDMETVQTNMVSFAVPEKLIGAADFAKRMNATDGIKMNGPKGSRIRLVTHYGIEADDIDYYLDAARGAIQGKN